MSLLRFVVSMLIALSLVGCAVSRNPNPMIRYGANTGATLAGPGFLTLCVVGALSEEDNSNKELDQIGTIGIAAAAGGFVVGALLGGTVGFFKWMFNGFEDDIVASTPDLPEEILPPAKKDEYGSK